MTAGPAVRRRAPALSADDESRGGDVSAGGGSGDWVRAARCLALDAATARIATVLCGADIPHLLVEGPATAHRLCPGRPDRGRYTDVDVLVPPDRFDDAESALAQSGYRSVLAGVRPGEFPWHETPWLTPDPTALHVVLRRGFAGVGDAAVFFARLWGDRELLAVGGQMVAVPSAAGSALIVVLYAAGPGRGRTPLTDVWRAGEVVDAAQWQEAATIARACDAESSCRAGLELLPGGSDLADRIGLDGTVTADQWPGGRQFDRVSVNLSAVLTQRGMAASACLRLRKLFPSPAFVRLWDVRARRGPVALAFAYGRRLRRAALAAARALLDVRSAARGVQRRLARVRVRRAHRAMVWSLSADRRSIWVVLWGVRCHRRVRRQLTARGLHSLDLPAPASSRPDDRRAVAGVLRARGATCLERAFILQRIDAAAGRPREVVIAVTAPGEDFRGHAWLDGDPSPGAEFHELFRCAPQPAWLPEVG